MKKYTVETGTGFTSTKYNDLHVHKWKKLNLCSVCNGLLIYHFLAYFNTLKPSFVDHLCAAQVVTKLTS